MARRRRGQFPKPKKENGQWKIRYYTDQAQPNGSIQRVRKTKCLGRVAEMTYREAQKEVVRFLQPINDVEPGIEHAEKTMHHLIQRWRTTVKPNFRLSTQLQYESMIGKWILPSFGRSAISDVGPEDVQSLLTDASQNLAYESVKGLRKVVRQVFAVAEDWGWIAPGTSPAKGRRRVPPRRRKRPPRVLTPSQARTLIAALPEPHATVVTVASFVGLRKGELEALRRNDLVNEGLIVDEAIYRRKLGPPKTPRSSSVLPLGPRTRRAIEAWLAMSKFREPDDFMFSTHARKPIDLHNSIRRVIKPMCRKLGIPEVSWHDFRYTFTTWGRQNAADIPAETMRDLLRHTDVKMTLDVYSQVSNGAEAVRQIERYVWSQNAPNFV